MFFQDAKSMAEIKGTFFDRPPARFDPVQGYRWQPPSFRMVRVINGEIIYDTSFRVNNYGCHCTYDYAPKKASPSVFRFIVFGDSFTNDADKPLAWPELLQDLLRSRPEHGRDVEVCQFSCDGGGLLNWYHTFKHLILPEFDFDAVIVADWFEDIGRGFTVFHSTAEGTYLGRYAYAQRPRTDNDLQRIFPQMERLYDVTTNEKIDDLLARLKARAQPARIDAETYCGAWRSAPLPPPGYVFSRAAFVQRYGEGNLPWRTPEQAEERWTMLEEIAAECRARGVPVVYSPMPTRDGVLRIKKEDATLLQQAEAQGIARHFGFPFFDGYGIFGDIDAQALVDYYWLRHDGHWGMPASALYAVKLGQWIVSEGFVKPLAKGPVE